VQLLALGPRKNKYTTEKLALIGNKKKSLAGVRKLQQMRLTTSKISMNSIT
jgi:hypothetical protein